MCDSLVEQFLRLLVCGCAVQDCELVQGLKRGADFKTAAALSQPQIHTALQSIQGALGSFCQNTDVTRRLLDRLVDIAGRVCVPVDERGLVLEHLTDEDLLPDVDFCGSSKTADRVILEVMTRCVENLLSHLSEEEIDSFPAEHSWVSFGMDRFKPKYSAEIRDGSLGFLKQLSRFPSALGLIVDHMIIHLGNCNKDAEIRSYVHTQLIAHNLSFGTETKAQARITASYLLRLSSQLNRVKRGVLKREVCNSLLCIFQQVFPSTVHIPSDRPAVVEYEKAKWERFQLFMDSFREPFQIFMEKALSWSKDKKYRPFCLPLLARMMLHGNIIIPGSKLLNTCTRTFLDHITKDLPKRNTAVCLKCLHDISDKLFITTELSFFETVEGLLLPKAQPIPENQQTQFEEILGNLTISKLLPMAYSPDQSTNRNISVSESISFLAKYTTLPVSEVHATQRHAMIVALASVVSKAPALCQEHGVGDVVSSAVQDGTTSKENLPFLISCFPDVLPSSEEERFQVLARISTFVSSPRRDLSNAARLSLQKFVLSRPATFFMPVVGELIDQLSDPTIMLSLEAGGMSLFTHMRIIFNLFADLLKERQWSDLVPNIGDLHSLRIRLEGLCSAWLCHPEPFVRVECMAVLRAFLCPDIRTMLIQLYEDTDRSSVLTKPDGTKYIVTLIDELEMYKKRLLSLPEESEGEEIFNIVDPLSLENEEGMYRPLLEVVIKSYSKFWESFRALQFPIVGILGFIVAPVGWAPGENGDRVENVVPSHVDSHFLSAAQRVSLLPLMSPASPDLDSSVSASSVPIPVFGANDGLLLTPFGLQVEQFLLLQNQIRLLVLAARYYPESEVVDTTRALRLLCRVILSTQHEGLAQWILQCLLGMDGSYLDVACEEASNCFLEWAMYLSPEEKQKRNAERQAVAKQRKRHVEPTDIPVTEHTLLVRYLSVLSALALGRRDTLRSTGMYAAGSTTMNMDGEAEFLAQQVNKVVNFWYNASVRATQKELDQRRNESNLVAGTSFASLASVSGSPLSTSQSFDASNPATLHAEAILLKVSTIPEAAAPALRLMWLHRDFCGREQVNFVGMVSLLERMEDKILNSVEACRSHLDLIEAVVGRPPYHLQSEELETRFLRLLEHVVVKEHLANTYEEALKASTHFLRAHPHTVWDFIVSSFRETWLPPRPSSADFDRAERSASVYLEGLGRNVVIQSDHWSRQQAQFGTGKQLIFLLVHATSESRFNRQIALDTFRTLARNAVFGPDGHKMVALVSDISHAVHTEDVLRLSSFLSKKLRGVSSDVFQGTVMLLHIPKFSTANVDRMLRMLLPWVSNFELLLESDPDQASAVFHCLFEITTILQKSSGLHYHKLLERLWRNLVGSSMTATLDVCKRLHKKCADFFSETIHRVLPRTSSARGAPSGPTTLSATSLAAQAAAGETPTSQETMGAAADAICYISRLDENRRIVFRDLLSYVRVYSEPSAPTESAAFQIWLAERSSTREPPTFAEESACTLLVGLSANWPTYVFEENEASDRLSPRDLRCVAQFLVMTSLLWDHSHLNRLHLDMSRHLQCNIMQRFCFNFCPSNELQDQCSLFCRKNFARLWSRPVVQRKASPFDCAGHDRDLYFSAFLEMVNLLDAAPKTTGIKDLIAEESLHWAFFSKDRSLSLFATRLWESLNLPFNNKRLESCFHLIFCAVRDGHYDKQLSLLDSLHRASREMIDDASSIQYVAHAAVAMLHTHMQEMFLRGLGIFRYIFKRTLKAPVDCEYRIEVMAGLKKAWASPSEDILQDEWILVCLLKGLTETTLCQTTLMVLEELLVLFADEMRHLNLLLISILLIHGILCANAARREDVSVVEDALDFIGRCRYDMSSFQPHFEAHLRHLRQAKGDLPNHHLQSFLDGFGAAFQEEFCNSVAELHGGVALRHSQYLRLLVSLLRNGPKEWEHPLLAISLRLLPSICVESRPDLFTDMVTTMQRRMVSSFHQIREIATSAMAILAQQASTPEKSVAFRNFFAEIVEASASASKPSFVRQHTRVGSIRGVTDVFTRFRGMEVSTIAENQKQAVSAFWRGIFSDSEHQEEEFESLSFAGVSANGEDFESDELLCASYEKFFGGENSSGDTLFNRSNRSRLQAPSLQPDLARADGDQGAPVDEGSDTGSVVVEEEEIDSRPSYDGEGGGSAAAAAAMDASIKEEGQDMESVSSASSSQAAPRGSCEEPPVPSSTGKRRPPPPPPPPPKKKKDKTPAAASSSDSGDYRQEANGSLVEGSGSPSSNSSAGASSSSAGPSHGGGRPARSAPARRRPTITAPNPPPVPEF